MKKYKIAVLMTCYNRKKITIACLENLDKQSDSEMFDIDIFLVDDGSTDGTGRAVKARHPDAHVIQGDGSLFWCGGMRLAFGEALKHNYDFYLWLNDDTVLFPNAIRKLVDTYVDLHHRLKADAVVVGSLSDRVSNELTYGGSRFRSRWHKTQYEMIAPGQTPLPCDVFHGNCVLIHQRIAGAVGNMSGDYKHGPGDKDYALRVSRAGFSSWICPGFVGTCSRNHLLERWRKKDMTLSERIEALNHPVVLARVKDWVVFTKKYHKWVWPSIYLRSLIRLHFPRFYIFLKCSVRFQNRSHTC